MTQKPNFVSARLKVEQAYRHILAVEEWLRRYRELNVHAIQIGVDFQTGEVNGGSGVSVTRPPVRLPDGISSSA